MEHRTRTALLRVLAAAAWADGEVTPAEIDHLSRMCDRLGVSADERERILSLTREPAGIDRFEAALHELGELVPTAEERQRLAAEIDELTRVDSVQTGEERRYLDLARGWAAVGGGGAEGERGGAAPWKGFWRMARERVGAAAGGLGEKLNAVSPLAAIEEAFRGRSPAGGGAAGRRQVALLFGALMERVIRADREITPEEGHRLRLILSEEFGFSSAETEEMMRVIGERIVHDTDRQRLCAEFNRVTEMDERLQLLRALFAAAQADGAITGDEEREIRLIANFLWIETQEYVRIRAEALGRAAGGAVA